jgi:hypothetical protein
MQLKEINIDLQLKVPGFWLKIRACLLGKRRWKSQNRIRGLRPKSEVAPGEYDS